MQPQNRFARGLAAASTSAMAGVARRAGSQARAGVRKVSRVDAGGPSTLAATADSTVLTDQAETSVQPPIERASNALASSAVFDPGYYRIDSGAVYRYPKDAARHFLTTGCTRLASFTPLIEPERLPSEVRSAWQRGDLGPAQEYLRRPASQLTVVSRYFDPTRLAAHEAEWADDPWGCVGWFLAIAKADTMLPGESSEVTWGTLKQLVSRAVSWQLDSRRLARPRTQDRWDVDAEQEWKHELRAAVPAATISDTKVSVVMPTWNRAGLLPAAIASVRMQTHDNWELLVIDDGSQDQTADVVTSLAAEDSRIRFLPVEHAGVCAARNAGIEQGHGQLVAFLDSDNVWEPDFLELMLKGMQRDDVRFAHSALESERDGTSAYRACQGDAFDLAGANHIDLNTLVVSRDVLDLVGSFDTSLRRWVDHDLVLRLAQHETPRLMPFIGCRYDNSRGIGDRITTSESDNWQFPVLAKHWEDWAAAAASLPHRVPGRVSVCMPVHGQAELTVAAVESVLATSDGQDVDVVLVDNGSDIKTAFRLSVHFANEPRVTYHRLARNLNFSTGSNIAAIRSTGEYVIFLNSDTEVQPGWLAPLVERLEDASVLGVQPLLVFPDHSIQSAGTVFVNENLLPAPFLVGLPPEDARGVEELDFSAVTAAALLMRARDVIALRGFDPIFANGMEDVDLCLRAARDLGGHFAVEPHSLVRHWESGSAGRNLRRAENRGLFMDRWHGQLPATQTDFYAHQGLEIDRLWGDGYVPPGPKVLLKRMNGQPRRWGIRQPAVGGVRGDHWGDTAFTDSLARALRELGEQVVTYRHGANFSSVECLDDVTLVLRGLDQVAPVPGTLNILWVISHPEMVTVAEVRAFDHVFAASQSWAEWMAARSGKRVGVLYQATDTDRFFPAPPAQVPTRPAVFVGSTHPDRPRPMVAAARDSGIPLRVIGLGWQDQLDRQTLESHFLDNSEVGEVYRSATAVLADHWGDMARRGFIQNRVFDALACGTPVISDEVTGLNELFPTAVLTATDPESLADAFVAAQAFSEVERRQVAETVRREHSFATRARFLQTLVGLAPPVPKS